MKLFAVETSRFPVPNDARAEGSASKRAKHRKPVKSAGTAGESLKSDHNEGAPLLDRHVTSVTPSHFSTGVYTSA